jgi:hypothetical protein
MKDQGVKYHEIPGPTVIKEMRKRSSLGDSERKSGISEKVSGSGGS